MIPRADVLELARVQGLLATTVDKDYVLGWLLYGIAADPVLSRWVFKGGTCLKKCFFETYRFSEDLDFTVHEGDALDEEIIRAGILRLAAWVERECGIQFPDDGLQVERYANPRGRPSYQARATYAGPNPMQRQSLQRVKFDITQDEVIAAEPELRAVHHTYRDAREPSPRVRVYSVEEILAEKTRDVYDVVHLNRSFRDRIDAATALRIAEAKFVFKELPAPTVAAILGRVDVDQLKASWDAFLGHQLPLLPPVETFVGELEAALAWWIEPATAAPPMPTIELKKGEAVEPRVLFPTVSIGAPGPSPLDVIRTAARNRFLALVVYHGRERLVEPYSLRWRSTGNLLLYVHERMRDGAPTEDTRAYKVGEIERATLTSITFSPRHQVEI